MTPDTTPLQHGDTTPNPQQPQQSMDGLDWRRIDFASDCLIMRSVQLPQPVPAVPE